MILNIVLVTIYFAVIGAFVHKLTGGGGGLLHKIFVACVGYILAQTCRDVVGGSIGLIWCIVTDVAGAVVVELILRRIRVHLLERKLCHLDDDRAE